MTKTLYVGNLSYNATEDQVRELFSQHGNVVTVKLLSDRETGRPRGFGFVEMDDEGADAAVEKLNNNNFCGRTLRVNEAREKTDRPMGDRPPRRDRAPRY